MVDRRPHFHFQEAAPTNSTTDRLRHRWFEQGLRLYRTKQWSAAGAKLKAAAEAGDGPAAVLLRRCHHLMRHPPDENWNGEWDMAHLDLQRQSADQLLDEGQDEGTA